MATVSIHYLEERRTRESIINFIGIGNKIGFYTWDRGHKNGKEAHIITDTGIIIIYNLQSRKLVTKLIAKPGQLERYYGKGKVPNELMELAREHVRLGYNRY